VFSEISLAAVANEEDSILGLFINIGYHITQQVAAIHAGYIPMQA
jgi:hypothetical protein